MPKRKPTLTPDEARSLRHEALVIGTQQPPVINGFLYTEKMQTAVAEAARQGMGRDEVAPQTAVMAAREIQTSPEAREAYLNLWPRSGVIVARAVRGYPAYLPQGLQICGTEDRICNEPLALGACQGGVDNRFRFPYPWSLRQRSGTQSTGSPGYPGRRCGSLAR